MIVFSTVFQCFEDAVNKFGLSSNIRTDLGGENVEVWRHLTQQHCHNSVVTGSSTHYEYI